MMAEPVLYSFRRCPYAMRARMALSISDTAHEVREVKLRDKPAAMIAASPKATVPVLVLTDGSVIDESIDIMRWALGAHDPEHWLAGDDQDLIAANDGPFKHHLDHYKYASRHDSAPEEHRASALALLEKLEQRLEGQPYLYGDRRSLTDAAIMPFVRQFAATDRAWFAAQALPRVQHWLARQLSSDLFTGIMQRRAQWRPAADMAS